MRQANEHNNISPSSPLHQTSCADYPNEPMKATDKIHTLVGALVCALTLTTAHAQRFPIPKTAAEVPGPAAGTAMTTQYVQTVGRAAYLWGWALVNNANRHKAFSEALDDPRDDTPDLLPPVGAVDHASVDTMTGKGAVREIKEWQSIMDHLCSLPLKNPGELPVIPVDERAAEIRAIKVG